MGKNREKKRKWVVLSLALLFVLETAAAAFAQTGVVTKAVQVFISEGGSTWSFQIDDHTGVLCDATCMEPNNQVIPLADTKVEMNQLSNTSLLAKVAYLGSKEFETDTEQYVVSRAAALAAGNIGKWQYGEQAKVEELYERAREAAEIPSDFQVYSVTPENGGQTMLAWRWIPRGFLSLKKTSSEPTDLSLAGARYGVYTSRSAADSNDWNQRIGTLETTKDGRSNILELSPGMYYVKETQAPAGFELDKTVHAVKVLANETVIVQSTDRISYGWMKIQKIPAENQHLVKACPNQYSLANAEYSIYSDSSLRQDTKVGSLTTKDDGTTDAIKLKAGTYYVRETKRPKGYDLDSKIHTVVIESQQTTTITSKETPLLGKINVLLEKRDGGGIGPKPSLAGAEFTVKYYDTFTDDIAGLTAKKTWKFETNNEGRILFTDSFKTGGDALYKDDKGQPAALPGTYVIKESRAPTGYVLNEKSYYAYVREEGDETLDLIYQMPVITNQRKVFRLKLQKVDGETDRIPQGEGILQGGRFGLYRNGELLDTYITDVQGSFTTKYYTLGDGSDIFTVKELTPPEGYLPDKTVYTLKDVNPEGISVQYTTIYQTLKNDVIKGNISLTKVYDAMGETGMLLPEEGVQFQIYLKDAGSYEAAKNTERDLITTDQSGYALSKKLPYGNYTVHQVNTLPGHDKVDDFDVCIDTEGKVYRYTLNNAVNKVDVTVKKVDSETGKIIPVPNTSFKIWDVDKEEWVSFKMKYPNAHVMDTFLTDQTGTFQLPDKLGYGQYQLKEQIAPEGYVLSEEAIPFKVDGFENHITVTAENTPQKGTIQISKTGEVFKRVMKNKDESYTPIFGEGFLQGAVFQVKAAEDIYTPDGTRRYKKGEIVDVITTDTDGKGVSCPLYLGSYNVTEIAAPDEHILDNRIHKVELTYAGQNVSITEKSMVVGNERQKVKITLKKILEEDVLYGYDGNCWKDVSFGIFAEEEITAEDGSVIPKDGLIYTTGITPQEGTSLCTGNFTADLPQGNYYVKEIKTAEGYQQSHTRYDMDVAYRGQDIALVEILVNDGEVIENEIIRGKISGHKVTTDGIGLAGAVMGLFMKDTMEFTEETALLYCITDEKGGFLFEDVAYGSYVIREIRSPEGYVLSNKSYPVVIDEDGDTISLQVANQSARAEIQLKKNPAALPQAKIKDEVSVPMQPVAKEEEKTPATGDERNLIIWMALVLFGITVMIARTGCKE